jgi:hexosaminidase
MMRRIVLTVLLVLAWLGAVPAAAGPALIPQPLSMDVHDGAFRITDRTIVTGSGGAVSTAAQLTKSLGLNGEKRGGSRISLSLVSEAVVAGPEAYHLVATPREIRIEASDPRGLFYGTQTLLQLVADKAGVRTIPAVEIRDSPRFRWRGLLLDLSRHFFGKQTLFKFIDEMAAYKLNILHLHLTDDPGWRLEIPGYPKLTEKAVAADGTRQYFTADEMREIVAYAAERHIVIVPEIEMPSHTGAAGGAYPELFNGGNVFDPASPKTYAFIRAVFTEVARLFPGPYIHFGGDEVGDDAWKDAKDVEALKAQHGLKDQQAVESYFGRQVVGIIQSVGKRPMAWDEQAEAGASKDVVIQWWRTGQPQVLSGAADAGYELVMSPVDRTYFDYHQGPGEPGAPWEGNEGGPTSIEKILAWEPVPDTFTPQQAAHVLGVEAAVWTEFIESERYLEFMTFPRLLALSEVAWRPEGPRDPSEFSARLEPHIEALRKRGINARRGEWDAYEFITN